METFVPRDMLGTNVYRVLVRTPACRARRSVGIVSEKSITRQQTRRIRRTITSRWNPAASLGGCSGHKFLVSSVEGTLRYASQESNRKFRLTPAGTKTPVRSVKRSEWAHVSIFLHAARVEEIRRAQ